MPESVEYIDDYVFQDCSGLLSVSLGSRVSHIGTECFSGLSGLQQFSVYAVEPPSLGSYVFNLTPVDKCKLLVPEESVDKYKEAEQWKGLHDHNNINYFLFQRDQMPLGIRLRREC